METKTEEQKIEEAQDQKEQEEYIYVYGITNNGNIKLNIKGLKNKPIEKIDFRDIFVLTSLYPTLHPMLEEDEAMQHADILKKISKKTTVIPMSFGTIFKDQEILEIVLSKSYQAVKNTLVSIDNKIELGVKVIKNQLECADDSIASKILKSLDELSIKSIKGDNFSDRLLLNHSFLVEKNKFSKFSSQIAKLEKERKDLKFIYTGPWPPYSFVNIKIAGE